MGILKGALSVRRYRVDGEVPEGWRDRYFEALNEHAFREPLSATHKEEIFGWVQAHNLLDAEFSDLNRWLYNHYALFSMRVDKKVLPARLFAAHFQKRQETWCKQMGRERCPPGVREEMKETLELEMLKTTLPRVQVHECAWNINSGWVLFHNDSDVVNDRFRKLFLATFQLRLAPWLPTDELPDPAQAEALTALGVSDLRGGAHG